jgi:hypothetical protein
MKRRKTGGRKKGSLNKTTREAKELCASLLQNPTYLRNLRNRVLDGTLPPALEAMLWHYAYGVPKQTVALETKPWPMYTLAVGCVPSMSPESE